MDNIPYSHYVVKLMHIWTIQWLITVHFQLARFCKKYWKLMKWLFKKNSIKIYPWKFCICKEKTTTNNLLDENFQFVLKLWCLYWMINKCLIIHYVSWKLWSLKVVKHSPIENVVGLNVVFLFFYKNEWKFKIHEKW